MRIMTSGLSNFFVYFIPLTGIPRLKDSFFSGREWMLWSVSSLFRMSRLCPATMPKTCGWYVQPFWSMTAAVAGGGYVPEIPDFTYTNTFARPLSGPTTTSSFATSPGCDFAQKASADILNFSAAGTAPSKTILPVTEAEPVAPAAGPAAEPAAEAAEAAGAAAPSTAALVARADLGRSSSSSLPPQPAARTAARAVTAQTETKRKRIAGPDMRASSAVFVVTAKDTTKAKLLVSLSLSPGTRIGPFEVLTPLGAGGMGEVYRAKDTRLGRTVALKVLPESFFEDKERVARFEREAKLLASLSHPNIAALYSFEETEGRHGIAMELLEGETLRETLRGGALPPGRAVEIGSQIARGLAAAHAKGIVHRDLKPENVFVTKDRRVKILDFGLAKLSPPKDGGEDLTSAGTRSLLTEAGAVFGTVGYMSPEQVRGESVDARSDLFALGTILCEMLTGKHVFRRGTAADTMSAILKEDPSELPVHVPASLARIVSRLLEKMPEDRFQSASDLGFSLEALSSPSGFALPAGGSVRPRRGPLALALGGALAALALVVAAFVAGKRLGVAPVVTYKRLTFQRGRILSARFAPDGQTILYTASWEGRKPDVYSTRIDSTESRPLGLPDVSDLFSVSPSAELLVRHRTAEGKDALAQVPLSSGAPRDLVEGATGASWAPDGKAFAVLFGQQRLADSQGLGERLEFPAGHVLV